MSDQNTMATLYQKERNFFVLGSIGVCATTRETCVKEIFALPTEPTSATVSFVGIPAVISIKENHEYANVYNSVSLVAIDGMPIVKMARRGNIVCERCSGPEIMEMILVESIKQKKTHYFYGGENQETLDKLRQNLENNYPGIQIAGMYSPPFRMLNEEEEKSVCDEINALKPDFLWVGIGAPKQDVWMIEHRDKIYNTTMLGVGAAFNFFAGTLDKAPKWVQDAGFEWLYRLVKEPKRLWKRYVIGGFKFILYSLKNKFVD